MNFEEFVEKAHEIVPVTETVFCDMSVVRYRTSIDGSIKYSYSVTVMDDTNIKVSFERRTIEECLTELKNYFDTL